VDDNYAGENATVPTPPEVFLARRAAAYQAYYEHMPLRRSSVPAGPDMQMYRTVPFGRLATFQVLDGRQYRSDQACGAAQSTPCPESLDPKRTMLGAAQERWLLDRLGSSKDTWNVLAQQTIMSRADRDPGPELLTSMDNWNGYSPARQRLFDGVAERGVDNLVVLTGDAHCSVAAELRRQYDDPDSATIGAEFVGTSVSSGGNGADVDGRGADFLASNPHMRFYNARRGYVECTVKPELWRSDYRAVPLTESVPQLNDACLLVCMIETVEGLNNVEAIAAVDGVDVLHVGSNDLLVNMGKPGKFDDPAIVAAQDRVIKAAKAHGKFAGVGGNRNVERQAEAVRRGAQFVTTQTDIGFLAAAAGEWTRGIRKALG